jgi:hypothetical protein
LTAATQNRDCRNCPAFTAWFDCNLSNHAAIPEADLTRDCRIDGMPINDKASQGPNLAVPKNCTVDRMQSDDKRGRRKINRAQVRTVARSKTRPSLDADVDATDENADLRAKHILMKRLEEHQPRTTREKTKIHLRIYTILCSL